MPWETLALRFEVTSIAATSSFDRGPDLPLKPIRKLPRRPNARAAVNDFSGQCPQAISLWTREQSHDLISRRGKVLCTQTSRRSLSFIADRRVHPWQSNQFF